MFRIFLYAALYTAPLSALAAPRAPGPADVRAGSNGAPCFTVEAQAEARDGAADFRAVTVTDVAGRSVAWKMALPPDRHFALTHAICIPYAGRVPALPQTPAVELIAGRIYLVQLDVRNTSPTAPRSYGARFCVVGPAQSVRRLGAGQSCSAAR